MKGLPPPSLDLTSVPITEAVELLRRIGTGLIEAIAHQEAAALSRLITPSQVPLLLPFAGRRGRIPFQRDMLGAWARQLGWWIARPWRRTWSPPNLAGSLYVSSLNALRAGRSEAIWRALAQHWMSRALGGVTHEWLADPFWRLAGELAWTDPSFRADCARTLTTALSRRVLFSPDGPPLPQIAPRTFWALIALTEIGRLPLRLFGLRRHRVSAALRRLRQQSALLAQAPGWADLWDQWLIIEALRIWPSATAHLPKPLAAAVLALPLRALLEPSANIVTAEPMPALAALGWDTHIPPWLATLAGWDREIA
jgi:hypothetical protein